MARSRRSTGQGVDPDCNQVCPDQAANSVLTDPEPTQGHQSRCQRMQHRTEGAQERDSAPAPTAPLGIETLIQHVLENGETGARSETDREGLPLVCDPLPAENR